MKTLMLLCSLVTLVPAAQWQVKIVGIKAGNTLEILHEGKVYAVKLHGIDCPAKTESFGKTARRFTAGLAFMADAQVEVVATESDGLLVARVVLAGERDLAKELVKNGMCWWDKQATPGEVALGKLEKQARDAYLGLWAGAFDDSEIDYGKEVLVKRDQAEKGSALLTAASGN